MSSEEMPSFLIVALGEPAPQLSTKRSSRNLQDVAPSRFL